ERVSYVWKFGDCTISHDIVGTPLNDVMRSASIRRSDSSGSHLYIPTSLRPGRNDDKNCTLSPETWNSGTVRIIAGENSGDSSTRLGSRWTAIAPPHSQPINA